MSASIGPKINTDSISFYIDADNIKTYINQNKLTSMINDVQKSSTATINSGYLYSNFGYIDKFNNIITPTDSAITVNTILAEDTLSQLPDD